MESPMAIFTMGKPAAGEQVEFTFGTAPTKWSRWPRRCKDICTAGIHPKGRLQKALQCLFFKDVCLPAVQEAPLLGSISNKGWKNL